MMFVMKKISMCIVARYIVIRANRDITRGEFRDFEEALCRAGYESPFEEEGWARFPAEVFYGSHANNRIPFGLATRWHRCGCLTLGDHAGITRCVC